MTVLKRHPLSRVCSEPLQRPDSLSLLGGCHSKFTLGSSQEWDLADGRAGSGAPAWPRWQSQLGPVTCCRLGKAVSAGVPRAALGGLCAHSVRRRRGARDRAEAVRGASGTVRGFECSEFQPCLPLVLGAEQHEKSPSGTKKKKKKK